MKRNPKRRYAIAALLAFIVATSSFAFAASNTVGGSSAGIGSGAVGGYTVSAVQWTLDPANPAELDAVRFTLDGPATDVRARALSAPGVGVWAACSVVSGNTFTCPLAAGVLTLPTNGLEVAAAS